MNLTIILRLYQGIQDAVSVLLENLTIPGKHSRILIMRNESQGVVLGRQSYSRTPAEVTSEFIESLNQHCRLDGHV